MRDDLQSARYVQSWLHRSLNRPDGSRHFYYRSFVVSLKSLVVNAGRVHVAAEQSDRVFCNVWIFK